MAPIRITLKEKDLAGIKQLMKKGDVNVRIIKRAQILKFRHHGLGTDEIVELLDVDPKLISITLNNYLEFGLKVTIEDAPRTGRPIHFDARDRSNIVALVCSEPPEGFARWTLDLIKNKCEAKGIVNSISRSSIQIILNEHELKPWREKMWCVPNLNDEYIERMEDILKIYERPYNPLKPVVCVDEKPVPLIGDRFERIPGGPGKIAKKDYQYTRDGSVNVFCAVEPLKGKYVNKVTENRKKPEFAKFINDISRKYKGARKIILVMDNLNTHKKDSLIEFYGEDKANEIWSKFEVHYTPKHASWLNQAEIAIGMYSGQCLGDGRVQNLEKLKSKTKSWNQAINKKATVIKWEFSRKKAREKFDYKIN
mgnify:CR=1 FL=1|jgi:hypothetical protein